MPSEEIQEAILAILCEQFERAPGTIILDGESVADDVQAELSSVSDDDVLGSFQLLYNDRKIDFTQTMGGPGTIELEPNGIDAYEELSGETIIPDADVEAVLEALAGEDTEGGELGRNELLERTGLDEDALDMAVWYLSKTGEVDAQIRVGRPWYGAVAITEAGRDGFDA